MRLKSCHIGDNQYSSATVEVEGLGEITVKDCIANDLRDVLERHIIAIVAERFALVPKKDPTND